MNLPAQALDIGRAARQPVYVYDLAVLRAQIARLQMIPWSPKRLFFATMANDHPEILGQVRDCGHGIFVNSLKHLSLGLDLGFKPTNIIYAASSMTPEEMLFCVGKGIHLVLDSVDQIEMLCRLVTGVEEIGIRVNVGSALNGSMLHHEPEYRFGILPEEMPDALAIARRGGLSIVGIHSYFGTDLMDWSILVNGLARLSEVAVDLPGLNYIDGGGGFGIADDLGSGSFDLVAYGNGVAEVMRTQQRRLGRPLALYIEPGRYLAAGCGWFFVKVVSRKPRRDRLFVGTNGSVSQFPRPLLYPERARHPWQIVGRETAVAHDVPVWLCGNSTYSRDFLARNAVAPAPEIGESIVFHNAGAYCRSMLTDFLGKERPREIIIDTANGSNDRRMEEVLAIETC